MLNKLLCFMWGHAWDRYIWVYWPIVDRPESLNKSHPDTYKCKHCGKRE